MNKQTPFLLLFLLVLATVAAVTPLRPVAAVPTYTQQRFPQEWIETGTRLNLTGDENATSYTLPFTFNFYATNYTTIWISTNGLISFTHADTDLDNSELALSSKKAIAPLWDDLVTSSISRTDLDVYVGLSDPDHLVIRWKALLYSQRSAEVNFEAILGRNAVIRFNYGFSNATQLSATVGISNALGEYYASSLTSSSNIDSFVYTPLSGIRPVLVYTRTPTEPWLVGETVTFNASASYDPDGTIVSYLWDFGDGTTSSTSIATHGYNRTGTFQVTVTITDDTSFTSSATFTGAAVKADARLIDTWPEARVLDSAANGNLTVSGRAINIESLPVYVQILFEFTNLKTGSITSLSSPIVLLGTREETTLSAVFNATSLTGRYVVRATLYFTPRDPSSPEPGGLAGTRSQFRFRIIAAGP